MDALLTIVGIIAGIIVVVIILALLAPRGYDIQRSIIINRPVAVVFNYVKYLRNQDNYSKWVMMDPNKKMAYTGTDGTVGFDAAWNSQMKQAGKGHQTIEGLVENERVDIKVVFERPMSGVADTFIATEPFTDGSTKVTWNFDSKMPFPMNALLLFLNMDKLLGADMETSLDNLKAVLEQ